MLIMMIMIKLQMRNDNKNNDYNKNDISYTKSFLCFKNYTSKLFKINFMDKNSRMSCNSPFHLLA